MQAAKLGSTADAIAMLQASLSHLAGVNWLAEGGPGQAAALLALEGARSLLTVAHGEALLALDVSGAHAADGHPTARTWLRHEARVTKAAARDQAGWVKFRGEHAVLWQAMADEELSESWARQIGKWTARLPEEEVAKADEILLDAARAGLALEPDIARLAQLIWQTIKGQQPDLGPDPDDDGYADRALRMGTTIGGVGKLTGDLSATCATLLAQVLATFGKRAGNEDTRTVAQRDHDALEEALRLALGVPGNPQAAGLKSRGLVIMSLADLRTMTGASALTDAWTEAQLGQAGWLSGGDADSAFCTSTIDPVVTGRVEWDVISQMADVVLGAHAQGSVSRQARLDLERALLAMAIDAVSGPGGLAAYLRTQLLQAPFNGQPLILDYGTARDIPDHLRKAVAMRDHHCQWPGGCDRPWWQCEPHHVLPRAHGGPTSIANLRMMCFFHHHVLIHRVGWTYRVHPDGTSEAISPTGKIVRSHSPPATTAA
jgi:hypothetical protein